MDANTWKRISYTLWSPIYNLAVGIYGRQRRRAFRLVNLQPGERVLIVGAGTGLDLDFIKPGSNITAIDLTPAMLARLQKRAQRLGLFVDARVMDGHRLNFPDASFDVAVLHLILAVIPEPLQCMREVARVLRPGGRAIIFDKFISDESKPPLLLRTLNPLASCIATELTRQLGPLIKDSGLKLIHEESAGLAGYLKIALVQKG